MGGRRKRLLASVALAVAAFAVVGVVIGVGVTSTTTAASSPRASSGAAAVQRRDLVETDTEAGTLSYSSPQTVYNRVSGTITRLPAVGQVIKQGQALYDVDGSPVILMSGTTPAYRDLTSGITDGADVLQLNQDLVKLGFNPDGIVVNDEWQTATTDGVEAFQDSLSETETGDLTLGQIVFLPGDQLIASVNATLGSTGGGSSATAASTPVLGTKPVFVDLDLGSGKSASGTASATTTPAADAAQASCPTTTSGTTTTTDTTCETTATTTTATTAPAQTTTTTSATTPYTPTTTTTTTGTTSTSTGSTGKAGKGSGSTSSLSVEQETLQALIALLKAQAKSGSSSKAGSSSSPVSSTPISSAGRTSSSGSSGASSSAASSSAPSSSSAASSGSSASGASSSSSGGASATAIMQTTSTQLIVTVDLSASSQSEAVVGERVTVEMPDGSVVDGVITAVSPVAQASSSSGSGASGAAAAGSSSSSSSSATVPVTIALRGHHTGAGLDQASVSVNFAEAKASNVLSVPVTALLATSGGNYAVQEAAAPHKLIAVTTGLFAAGYVQISGAGIHPGLQVTDSQG